MNASADTFPTRSTSWKPRARLCEFSPLRDDRLPPGTDVVYIGCGHPERFAKAALGERLHDTGAQESLMLGSSYLRRVRRTGLFAHEVVLADGTRWPMVGALGVTACYNDTPTPPEATELTVLADTWLGQSPQHWRGYLNPHWAVALHSTAERSVAEIGHESDVVHSHQAVGSRMYVDFAARQDLLERFFAPHHHATSPANLGCHRAV